MPGGPILVTGAAGFVGRHLLDAPAGDSPVVGWHRPGPAPPATEGVTWTAVELLDRDQVAGALDRSRPGAIYHCAGVAHVGESWAQAEDTMAANVVGTAHLFDALRDLGLRPRVLVTGSAAIYRPDDSPLTEDSEIAPNTPYGTSKLAQEMVALRAFADAGIPAVVTRSFNHVGAGQSPAFAASSFARQLARIEAGLDAPTLAVGNLAPLRDVSDVRDTVRAYVLLMAHGRPGVCYNVCSGRAVSVQDILDGLRKRVTVDVEVRTDPARLRPSDTPRIVGSHARLAADTGWTPRFTLDATLDALMAYWRDEIKAGRD
jgi:GDP-4-dehydro-6-deoxy-D-mannose reductase